ncbi:MAG: cell division protein ZapA [Bdellovibrionaceae bacterium]|jgi:cell division protein ZapA|nr:cell division protein ZapA [Pseudobdellovibrionaceae bacterium]
MDKKASFEFLIAGMPYRLKTSHDGVLVQELVQLVTSKMDQAMAATKSGSYQNAAVLAALNLAEELVLLKKRASRELERLEEKTLRLALDLENSRNQKSSIGEKSHQIRSFSDEFPASVEK